MSETDDEYHLVEEKAALLCGVARWRVALHDKITNNVDISNSTLSHNLKFDRQDLQNILLCVDSDIVRMFSYPAASAGYLGLHYFGSADKIIKDDFAAAVSLTNELARFIFFQLECRQGFNEAKLLLPSHAIEVQRRFERTRIKANEAIELIDKEWTELSEKAIDLVNSLSADDDQSFNQLLSELQQFIKKWLGGETGCYVRLYLILNSDFYPNIIKGY